VVGVTEDGNSQLLGMEANLMRFSGAWPHFPERVMICLSQTSEVTAGIASTCSWMGRDPFAAVPSCDLGGKLDLVVKSRLSICEHQIPLAHLVSGEEVSQFTRRLARAGEDDRPGGPLVETVADAKVLSSSCAGEILDEPLALAIRAVGGDTGWFVGEQEGGH